MTDATAAQKLTIEIDEDDITVYANIIQDAEAIEYSEQWLEQQLAIHGLSGLCLLEPANKEIEKLFSENKPGKVKLGIKQDAKLEVIMSKDLLSATLKIIAAKGGKEIEMGQVVTEIDQLGIDHQLVNKKRIVGLVKKSRIIEPGEEVEVLFAKGKPPEHGKDTQFECLIDGVTDRKPSERDDGTLDYYDLGEILCIDEGCELMRKHPPLAAKIGLTVTGEEIPARIGKSLNFKKCKGAKVSPIDKDLLIAEIKGQPIIANKGVSVDKVLTVKKVDLHTGHIEYDGSVVVKGDVASGMKIKVTGDVQVFGMVENASIEAEGNIDIKLGAIGHAETVAESDMLIRCWGNLTAAYIENALVDVRGDLIIKSRVSNCEVNTGHQIIVGNHKQQKSGIVGGHVNAGKLIRAEVLGSSGCALTHVAIVCKADVLEQFESIKEQITTSDKKLIKQLGLMVSLSKQQTEEARKELVDLKIETEAMKVSINNLIEQKTEIELLMTAASEGKVIVKKEAYPGVYVKILDQEQEIKAKYSAGSFILVEGVLAHNNSVE